MTVADADMDARRAYAAINRLSSGRRRSLAQFTCLCPEGCPLVVAYRRKRAGKNNALIVASTERSVFLELDRRRVDLATLREAAGTKSRRRRILMRRSGSYGSTPSAFNTERLRACRASDRVAVTAAQ